MATISSSTPLSTKAIIERNRRALINEKVAVLRDLFIEPSFAKKISCGEVLNRAAFLLNGQDPNTPIAPAISTGTPGPIRCPKETRKNREQGRRDLQTAGFDALKKFVIDNGLSPNTHLDRPVLLDIVIEQVKKIMALKAFSAPVAIAQIPVLLPQVISSITPEYLIHLCKIIAELNQQTVNTDL